MRNFRNLDVWKEGIVLVKEVYLITERFPKTEQYGLTAQIKRAVVSIPSNIAEGCSRSTSADFARFLEIALGSAYELETQLMIASLLGYTDESIIHSIIANLNSLQRRVNKLRERIK